MESTEKNPATLHSWISGYMIMIHFSIIYYLYSDYKPAGEYTEIFSWVCYVTAMFRSCQAILLAANGANLERLSKHEQFSFIVSMMGFALCMMSKTSEFLNVFEKDYYATEYIEILFKRRDFIPVTLSGASLLCQLTAWLFASSRYYRYINKSKYIFELEMSTHTSLTDGRISTSNSEPRSEDNGNNVHAAPPINTSSNGSNGIMQGPSAPDGDDNGGNITDLVDSCIPGDTLEDITEDLLSNDDIVQVCLDEDPIVMIKDADRILEDVSQTEANREAKNASKGIAEELPTEEENVESERERKQARKEASNEGKDEKRRSISPKRIQSQKDKVNIEDLERGKDEKSQREREDLVEISKLCSRENENLGEISVYSIEQVTEGLCNIQPIISLEDGSDSLRKQAEKKLTSHAVDETMARDRSSISEKGTDTETSMEDRATNELSEKTTGEILAIDPSGIAEKVTDLEAPVDNTATTEQVSESLGNIQPISSLEDGRDSRGKRAEEKLASYAVNEKVARDRSSSSEKGNDAETSMEDRATIESSEKTTGEISTSDPSGIVEEITDLVAPVDSTTSTESVERTQEKTPVPDLSGIAEIATREASKDRTVNESSGANMEDRATNESSEKTTEEVSTSDPSGIVEEITDLEAPVDSTTSTESVERTQEKTPVPAPDLSDIAEIATREASKDRTVNESSGASIEELSSNDANAKVESVAVGGKVNEDNLHSATTVDLTSVGSEEKTLGDKYIKITSEEETCKSEEMAEDPISTSPNEEVLKSNESIDTEFNSKTMSVTSESTDTMALSLHSSSASNIFPSPKVSKLREEFSEQVSIESTEDSSGSHLVSDETSDSMASELEASDEHKQASARDTKPASKGDIQAIDPLETSSPTVLKENPSDPIKRKSKRCRRKRDKKN